MNIAKTATAAAVCAVLAATSGCMTQSRRIAQGETIEEVAGFSTRDLEYAASQAVQGLDRASARYHVAGSRRIVNVKPFKIDTLARGGDAERIANDLEAILREEMTNSGAFIVFDPEAAASMAASGQQTPYPEYVLDGVLQQRNERKDNGDYYQSFSLLLKLVASPYHSSPNQRGLQVWQKRIPLMKEVDRRNALR